MTDCRTHAETIAQLGRLTCTLTLRLTTPGAAPALSSLRIETSRPRDPGVGGGVHAYTLHADAGGSDELALHAILRELADLLPERCAVTAAARNAFEDRDREAARRRDAEDRLAAALRGRAPGRISSRALVRLTTDGAAWVLDPAKQEAGMGLRYDTLAALWRDQPHLRPVEWGDDWLIVEPFALEAP